MVTFQGVGYEFGVEMTFPVAESVSAGLLNAVSQVTILYIYSISLLYYYRWLVHL